MSHSQPITLTSGLLTVAKQKGIIPGTLRSTPLVFKPPHGHLLCLVMLHPAYLLLSPISKFLAHFCSEVFGFVAFAT